MPFEEISNKGITKQISQQDQVDECLTHGQKFQAFCEIDRQLLCIDCVIKSEHKSHSMLNIDQAFAKYSQQAESCLDSVKTFDFNHAFREISLRKDTLKSQAEQSVQKVNKFSEYLIAKINKRKSQTINLINSKLNQEIEDIERFEQYFVDTKNQMLLTKDLLQYFQQNEKFQFLSQLYLIDDLLQVSYQNDLKTRADQINLLGSCQIIDNQFKIQEELYYFIQAFKKRLRILQTQSHQNSTLNISNTKLSHNNPSEFKVTSQSSTQQTPMNNHLLGSGTKIQDQIHKTQILQGKRPQSQSSNIDHQQKFYMKDRKESFSNQNNTLTLAGFPKYQPEKGSFQRSRQQNQHQKYDTERLKLSTYSTRGPNTTNKMTVIESSKNNTIIETQISFAEAAEQSNTNLSKTLNKKYPLINFHKKNASFLDMKRLVSSRTPKMNQTSNTLSKVYYNIESTKKMLERRQVRSNERQKQIVSSQELLLINKSSENVSSSNEDNLTQPQVVEINGNLKNQSCRVSEQSPSDLLNKEGKYLSQLKVIEESNHKESVVQNMSVSQYVLESAEKMETCFSHQKPKINSTRKKWNIPKAVKSSDELDCNTEEFDFIRSIEENVVTAPAGIGILHNSSQITLRRPVILTPQMAKPGMSNIHHAQSNKRGGYL